MKIKYFLNTMPAWLAVLLVSCTSVTPLSDNTSTTNGLKRASAAGLHAYLTEKLSAEPRPVALPSLMPNAAGAARSAEASPAFSTTNLQEQGVDEADLLKTDGRYLYAIGVPNDSQYVEDTLRIMQISEDGARLNEINRLKLSPMTGLYLASGNKQLVSIGSSFNQTMPALRMPRPYLLMPEKTDLQYVDVSNPAAAKPTLKVSLDGSLIASRRINNTLYLVLRSYPRMEGLGWVPYASSEENKAKNKQALASMNVADLLPTYSLNGAASQPLVATDNCYINQQESKEQHARHEIVSIVALDLNANSLRFNSRCFVGSTETLYASPQALYVATTDYHHDPVQGSRSSTGIHKFAFAGTDIAYRGTGDVPGNLGWKEDQRPFRLSEQDGLLRVITYNDTFTNPTTVLTTPYGKSPAILSILKEGGESGLTLVSQLPNRQRPAHLGKPDEQLYATRFIGDSAYLVTFQSTDPLYVLDMSNPQDPYIAGELQIPGFSDYLHPVGKHLLLGIGKDAIPAANGEFRGAWYQGLKLSLIDTSNPGNLREVDKLILGKRGTDSAALHDHHAVTTLPAGNSLRVALPVRLHETPQPGMSGQPSDYYGHTQTGLYRFEIDQSARKIRSLPPLITEKAPEDFWHYPERDRSIISGNNVHYFHNGAFWSQDWAGSNAVAGKQ